jgi:hypothetical protein
MASSVGKLSIWSTIVLIGIVVLALLIYNMR